MLVVPGAVEVECDLCEVGLMGRDERVLAAVVELHTHSALHNHRVLASGHWGGGHASASVCTLLMLGHASTVLEVCGQRATRPR